MVLKLAAATSLMSSTDGPDEVGVVLIVDEDVAKVHVHKPRPVRIDGIGSRRPVEVGGLHVGEWMPRWECWVKILHIQ